MDNKTGTVSVTFRLDTDLHKRMKHKLLDDDVTIQAYLTALIKADLDKPQEAK